MGSKPTCEELEQRVNELEKENARLRRAENALQESEERLRILFDFAPDGYYLSDLKGNFIDGNRVAEKIVGYKKEELIGESFLKLKLLSSKQIPKAAALLAKNALGKPTGPDEFTVNHKDGTQLTVDISTFPVTIEGKTVVLGIARDITERKRAEEVLRGSEEKYRSLYASMNEGVALHEIIYDETGKAFDYTIVEVNPAFESILGIKKEQAIGSKVSELYGTDRPPYIEIYSKVAESGEPTKFETYFLPMDKHFSISVFSPKKGRFATVFSDITERKKAEEELTKYRHRLEEMVEDRTAELSRTNEQLKCEITERVRTEEDLRKSEEKYRLISESTSDLITVTTFGLKPTYTYVSPSLKAVMGYEPEDLLGKSGFQFIHPDDTKRLLPLLKRYLSAKTKKLFTGKDMDVSETIEYRARDKSGNWHYLQSMVNFIGDGLLFISRDITERKRAEEALRGSEEKYRLLTEDLSDVVLTVSRGGRLEYVSPAVKEFGGYDPEQELGNHIARYFAKKSELIYTLKLIKKVIIDKKPASVEFLFQPNNKEPFYVEVTGKPIIKKNRVLNIQCVMRDISERKKAEEALRESEEKYRTILESIEDGYFENDIAGNLTFFNNSMCSILGYSEDELTGINNRQYMDQENANKVYQTFNKVYSTGIPEKGLVYEIIRKDGTIRHVETSVSLIKDSESQIMGFRGIIRDITERKRAEGVQHLLYRIYKAIYETEDLIELSRVIQQELSTLLDTKNFYISLYDKENDMLSFPYYENEKDQLETIPAGNSLTGYVINNVKAVLLTREDMTKLAQCGEAVVLGTMPKVWLGVPLKASGEVIGVLAVQSYTDESDFGEKDLEILRFVSDHIGFSIDHKRAEEERKKLQAQLQRAQKMEAIGTLAGGVAHDLNNVLSGLVSYPELLLLEIPEDSPLRKPILTIQKSGEKAAAIVQDLLTLARRGVAATEAVNLSHIISEYLKSPEQENLKSFHPDVQVEVKLETDLLNILGSSVHLSKTVMNLVSNAVEAMPDGGTVSISTENRYIDRPIRGYDRVEEGDYVILRVSDSGVGIASEDMERIFEPFYTKKVMGRSGTGLGMAVVWGTVKDHKGYIDAQSSEGKGTTFTLYFPVARDKSLLSIEDYMGKGESILVVDDVEDQREIASRMLKRLGYTVTSVSSGEEAIEYMKDNSADLLILDMIMDPGIDGLEAYKRILEFHPKQKAIIVSGFSETERVKEAQRLCAGAYVKKPYLLEKIGAAIRDELDK